MTAIGNNLIETLNSFKKDTFTKDEIVSHRTIDVHIRKLREKLGVDNIKTFKAVGYMWAE
jgi:two-component system alkaline phosphatase synthesis response regulator PhoP